MIQIEELYQRKLKRLAKEENKKMRQGMGYNVEEEKEFSSPVLKVLEDLGEGTVNDIAVRLKIKAPEVNDHLRKLKKLNLVTKETMKCRRTPAIWSIKL